jgi:DNA-binding Lrp family transcriptional regulator
MTARQLSEPRTANWIASEAGWSHEPTKRVLERLVDDGILHRDESGTHTTYYPDYRRQAMQEAMRLRDSGHTVEELTDRLTDMKTQIRDWEDEFGVESPNQLRGTLADESLDAEEEDRRREIARKWEYLQRRIQIVGFAIREWDFLAPTTESPEASNSDTSASLHGVATVDEMDDGFSDEDVDVWMETAIDPIGSESDLGTEDS